MDYSELIWPPVYTYWTDRAQSYVDRRAQLEAAMAQMEGEHVESVIARRHQHTDAWRDQRESYWREANRLRAIDSPPDDWDWDTSEWDGVPLSPMRGIVTGALTGVVLIGLVIGLAHVAVWLGHWYWQGGAGR